MVDRLKDAQDKNLEKLFGSDSIHDGGFSARVVSRVRQRMWVRRLSLPVAFTLGFAVSVKPLTQLIDILSNLASSVPLESFVPASIPLEVLPQLPTIVMGVALLVAAMLIGRMVEDA